MLTSAHIGSKLFMRTFRMSSLALLKAIFLVRWRLWRIAPEQLWAWFMSVGVVIVCIKRANTDWRLIVSTYIKLPCNSCKDHERNWCNGNIILALPIAMHLHETVPGGGGGGGGRTSSHFADSASFPHRFLHCFWRSCFSGSECIQHTKSWLQIDLRSTFHKSDRTPSIPKKGKYFLKFWTSQKLVCF